jgi:hypothetical protein
MQQLAHGGGIGEQYEGEAFREIRRLEQAMLAEHVPSYERMRNLGEHYHRFAADATVPPALRDRARLLATVIRSELAGLDKMLLTLGAYEADFGEQMRLAPPRSVNYYLGSRLYLGTMFLVHSPAVWRVKNRPVLALPVPADFSPSPNVKTFTQLRRILPEDDLIRQTATKQRLGARYMREALEPFKSMLAN